MPGRTKVKYAPKDITLELIEEKRQEGLRWETRSMSGHPGGPEGLGIMPPETQAICRADRSRVDYTIVSYDTPIGWHIAGKGWRVPDICYSATTTSQQRLLRMLKPQVTS